MARKFFIKTDKGDIRIRVSKCKKPSFKMAFGRTWDNGYVNINGVRTKAFLDTTWGQNIYFQYGPENQWHTTRMWSKSGAEFQNKDYDIDPFSNKPAEIVVTG